MKLSDLLRLDATGANAELLRRATRIAEQLPDATDGSQITLAFGGNRELFAASLVAVWSKGHGAAIVENDLRDRIMPVLDRPAVAKLLHDTGSGRKVQVPRLLDDGELPAAAIADAELAAKHLLTVHVQTEDGIQHWCSWSATELGAAITDVTASLAAREWPAGDTFSPGMIGALFANTLVPLQQGMDIAQHAPIDARGLTIPGVPDTTSAHQPRIEQMLAIDGITDAAVTCTDDGRVLTALAGPRAQQVAAETTDALAFANIPRDPNGQALAPEIFLAFGLGRTGNPIQRDLDWRYGQVEPTQASLRCDVPGNYVFYEGHFTNYPVLAGGAQLHELVLPCLERLCDPMPVLQSLDSVKFLARVTPGDAIDVIVKRGDDCKLVTFEVRKADEDVRCTTGRLHFATDVPDFTAQEA